MTGRGRGEGAKLAKMEDASGQIRRVRPGNQLPVLDVESSSSDSEEIVRGRGGYRGTELRTIPTGVREVKATNPSKCKPIDVMANFVSIVPMKEREIYKYRIDFKPNIDSVILRRRLFRLASTGLFSSEPEYDGMSDARSSCNVCQEKVEKTVQLPDSKEKPIAVIIQQVGQVTWESFEMIRLYNLNMKAFLRALGFFQVSRAGAYVHPGLKTPINDHLLMVRGFDTSANVHEGRRILINLGETHKLMQTRNVLQVMAGIRNQVQGNYTEAIKAGLTGKLVVSMYNKMVYRIEDVNFEKSPKSTFRDNRENRDVTYAEYFQRRYELNISSLNQPLLLVVQNNRRNTDDQKEIFLVPELCNIAGLTDEQRNDTSLRFPMIKASQVSPKDRVQHLRIFLGKLHSNQDVAEKLSKWGYSYEKDPIKIKARVLPTEVIGTGRTVDKRPEEWSKVDISANFERVVQNEALAVKPDIPKLAILYPRSDFEHQKPILTLLKNGFERIGLQVPNQNVRVIKMEDGDSASHYIQHLRRVDPDTKATVVFMSRQNKERYDAIKKIATVERGLITQVVTCRLMTDQKKANGASIKIGVQVAAKVGGEPWHVNIRLENSMICGFDTYHDTAHRGRSFGAFVASTNDKFSRWFSRSDMHERLEELSAKLATNMAAALKRYKEINGQFPQRIWFYRDGVSEGQLAQVYQTEMEGVLSEIRSCSKDIKTTIIIVNKRIGARFYMRGQQAGNFDNCPPGTVIDDVVTRQERYDFYLISSSTRAGTVSPTYYNIIHDDSYCDLDAAYHQALTYKLCLLYYNWTGSVRVPAPCQYAHKLAFLCGEHLHQVPNANLDDRLHFL